MSSISNYLEEKIINHFLRGTAAASPATVYLALYTSDPTDADTGAEVTGGGYVRQQITLTEPTEVAYGTYVLVKSFASGDVVEFNGVAFTATSAIQNATNFQISSNTVESMDNLATALNDNPTINATYVATTAPNGTITVMEKTTGGTNVPDNMVVTGTGSIISGTGATRMITRNAADVEFAVATANWGTVTHAGVRDAATGGNLLLHGKLNLNKNIGIGDQFRVPANQLTFTLD